MFQRKELITQLSAGLMLSGLLLASSIPVTAHGESLFRVGAQYTASIPYTPHSLYSQPRPKHVGDIVTIQINETSSSSVDSELEIERDETITENKTDRINQILHNLGVPDRWNIPSFSGTNVDNDLDSGAETSRTASLQDSISCQVVQVLPNGYLLVQGRKVVLVNKERLDMFVSGIVNPYYVDQNSQIQSNQVANFQISFGGSGVVTRQQSDGLANKVYQYLH